MKDSGIGTLALGTVQVGRHVKTRLAFKQNLVDGEAVFLNRSDNPRV